MFKRVYHPYDTWEEIRFNMWGDVTDKKVWIAKAEKFTSDHKQYGHYMRRVVKEWPISCENALTDSMINRKAWIGHAAVALAIQCPEDIVRQAWGMLTNEQRILANNEANRAIIQWENAYMEDKQIHQDVDKQMLFGWDT